GVLRMAYPFSDPWRVGTEPLLVESLGLPGHSSTPWRGSSHKLFLSRQGQAEIVGDFGIARQHCLYALCPERGGEAGLCMAAADEADHARAGGDRGASPYRRIFDDDGGAHVHAQRGGGVEIDVGMRLAARDMLASAVDMGPERLG